MDETDPYPPAEQRADLIDRLRQDGDDDLAEKLEKCGEELPLTCTNCGNRHTVEVRCRRRWCPACAPIISAQRLARYAAAVEQFQWPLFITLTVPNSTDPESVRELRAAFGRFRRRKLWKEKIRSGVAGIEVTNKGNGWHPHLHALTDCRWLSITTPEPTRHDSPAVTAQKCTAAQNEVAAAWADLTRNRQAFVWIRRADPRAIREILKYATKGTELITAEQPPGALIRIIERSRMISAFGELHGNLPDIDDGPTVACRQCGEAGHMFPDFVVQSFFR